MGSSFSIKYAEREENCVGSVRTQDGELQPDALDLTGGRQPQSSCMFSTFLLQLKGDYSHH